MSYGMARIAARLAVSTLLPASLLLAGCGAGPADDAAGSAAQLSATSAASRASAAPAADAGASATLIFSGSDTGFGYGASTPLVAGDTLTVSYDPSRVTACEEAPQAGGAVLWATTGFAQLPDGTQVTFPVLGDNAGATLPSFALPFGAGGDLAVWFETTNASGCVAADSDYGANFHFTVAPSPGAPSWIGSGDVVLSRDTCGSGACDADRVALATSGSSFTFDPWARTRASIGELEFQVYSQGVTDFPNPNLWKVLDVEIHYRFGGAGPYAMAYVPSEDYVGHNARYAFDLAAIDPIPGENGGPLASAAQCPSIPLTLSADGQSVVAAVDFWFTVNGVAYRPSAGATFSGTFTNYAGLYAVCNVTSAPASP